MKTKSFRSVSVLVAGLAACGVATAADYDEAIDGDLSTDPLAPTSVGLEVGANEVRGTVQSPPDTRDYITFEVAEGELLTGLFLLEYTDVASGGNGDRGYIHIDDGPTSVVPGGGTIFDFLGGSHLDRGIAPDETFNLLEWLSGAPTGGSGFTAPLGAGAYTINVQQTGAELTRYRLSLVVESLGPTPCNAADVAEPLGVLDLADIDMFVEAFLISDSTADLVEPFGIVDLSDINAFTNAFLAGCP